MIRHGLRTEKISRESTKIVSLQLRSWEILFVFSLGIISVRHPSLMRYSYCISLYNCVRSVSLLLFSQELIQILK